MDFTDLSNRSYSSHQSIGVNANVGVSDAANPADPTQSTTDLALNSSTYSYQNESSQSLSNALATIGEGNISVGGEDADPSGLNRDVDNLTNDIYAVDRQQGNIDLTVDHRLLSEDGRAQIAEDFDEIRQSAQVAYIRLTEEDSTSRDIRIAAIDELGLSWGESGELVNRDDVQAIAEAADEFYDAVSGNPVSWFIPEADDSAIGSSADDSDPSHGPLEILLTEGSAGDVILTNIVEVAGNVATKLEQVDPRIATVVELGLSAAGGMKSAVQYVVERGIAETPLGDVFAEFISQAGQVGFIEVKTGNAGLSSNQAAIFQHVGDNNYIIPADRVLSREAAGAIGVPNYTPGMTVSDAGYPNGIPVVIQREAGLGG